VMPARAVPRADMKLGRLSPSVRGERVFNLATAQYRPHALLARGKRFPRMVENVRELLHPARGYSFCSVDRSSASRRKNLSSEMRPAKGRKRFETHTRHRSRPTHAAWATSPVGGLPCTHECSEERECSRYESPLTRSGRRRCPGPELKNHRKGSVFWTALCSAGTMSSSPIVPASKEFLHQFGVAFGHELHQAFHAASPAPAPMLTGISSLFPWLRIISR